MPEGSPVEQQHEEEDLKGNVDQRRLSLTQEDEFCSDNLERHSSS